MFFLVHINPDTIKRRKEDNWKMKAPHLVIKKHLKNKAFFGNNSTQNKVICSVQHNCSDSLICMMSFVDSVEFALQRIQKEHDTLGGTYYVVQNSVPLKRNEENLTLSVYYGWLTESQRIDKPQ